MPSVHHEISDHVMVLTLDNPPVNAVAATQLDELRAAFRLPLTDRDIHAVVLTGAGQRAFCAGKDLVAPDPDEPVELRVDRGFRSRAMLESVRDCPVPVVAAVNGPAIGGGVSLLSMCDSIVAVRDAWISVPEINVGLLGAFSHVVSLVGLHRARRLYFSGDRLSMDELHAIGAVIELTEPNELLDTALAIAGHYAAKDPVAVRLAKEMMNRIDGLSVRDAYRIEQDYTARLMYLRASTAEGDRAT